MRATLVELGRPYVLRERVWLRPVRRIRTDGGRSPGFPGWSGWVHREVTAVDVVRPPGRRQALVVVEADRWALLNGHEWSQRPGDAAALAGRPSISWAMVNGKLRYGREPYRWQVPVRSLIEPAERRPRRTLRPVSRQRGHLTLVAAS